MAGLSTAVEKRRDRLKQGEWGARNPFYLFAVVLRTEFFAEFGDSSDSQRAARPQRTVYRKGKPLRVRKTRDGLTGAPCPPHEAQNPTANR